MSSCANSFLLQTCDTLSWLLFSQPQQLFSVALLITLMNQFSEKEYLPRQALHLPLAPPPLAFWSPQERASFRTTQLLEFTWWNHLTATPPRLKVTVASSQVDETSSRLAATRGPRAAESLAFSIETHTTLTITLRRTHAAMDLLYGVVICMRLVSFIQGLCWRVDNSLQQPSPLLEALI